MASAYKTYGNQHIEDDNFLSVVGAVSWVVNGVLRLILGSSLDWFSFKKVYGFVLVV